MKKIALMIPLIIAVICLNSKGAGAGEENISLAASASSTYSNNSSYGADKAIDENYNTYWLGERYATPWWISFDAEDVYLIDKINITWYSTYYIPLDYDIQISTDGITWENIYTNLTGVYNIDGTTHTINRDARFIRLYVRSANGSFPVLREFEAYAKMNIPSTMKFQGTLGDTEGNPMSGSFRITFRLYDKETGGSILWEETKSDVDIQDGMLDVELGSLTPFELPFNKQYWLGVEIESDGEMTPRFKLTAVPYALRAL